MSDASMPDCNGCGEPEDACACEEIASIARELEAQLTRQRRINCVRILELFLAGKQFTIYELANKFQIVADEVEWCLRYMAANRLVHISGTVEDN